MRKGEKNCLPILSHIWHPRWTCGIADRPDMSYANVKVLLGYKSDNTIYAQVRADDALC